MLTLYDGNLLAKSQTMIFNFELLFKKCTTLFSSQDFLKKINWNQQQGNYAVIGCTYEISEIKNFEDELYEFCKLLAESYDETILENILRGQEGTSPMPCKLRAYFEAIKFVIFLVEF